MMKDKAKLFAEASVAVFSKYSIKHGTMAQVAREAGVSRQTLYTVYSSKSDMLLAGLRYDAELRKAETLSAWEAQDDLSDKLRSFFRHDVLSYYRGLFNSVETLEIEHDLSFQVSIELDRISKSRIALIQDMLKNSSHALNAHGMTTARFAGFIVSATDGLLHKARDEAHLKNLLDCLKISILSVIGTETQRLSQTDSLIKSR